MKKNNFSIENCECLNKICPFHLKYFLISLKDQLLSNQNPSIEASNEPNNIDSFIKAKKNLNDAIKKKILIDNKPNYISPSIILNTFNKKESNQAKKDIQKKRKIDNILETSTFKNNDKNTNITILIKNYIKLNYIKQGSFLSLLFIITILLIFFIMDKE